MPRSLGFGSDPTNSFALLRLAFAAPTPVGLSLLVRPTQRLGLTSKTKPRGVGAAKASLNRPHALVVSDPQPSDLGMSRLKVR